MEGIVKNPFTITVDGVFLLKDLKHNLLNVSQLYDKGYSITFDTLSCSIEHKDDTKLVFKGSRVDNIYMVSLYDVSKSDTKCLISRSEDS